MILFDPMDASLIGIDPQIFGGAASFLENNNINNIRYLKSLTHVFTITQSGWFWIKNIFVLK